MPRRPETEIDLNDLPFSEGGFILVERALRTVEPDTPLLVTSSETDFALHLAAWCRQKGCSFEEVSAHKCRVTRPKSFTVRAATATPAGTIQEPAASAPESWGLAARGAMVEPGITGFYFPLKHGDHIWTKRLTALYRRAAAAQWNPDTAIDWSQKVNNPPEIEEAVVQIMTYLIENETAALLIPARFASQVHPQYFEVMQLLAIQAADEARHIEVFRRRAMLHRDALGLSTAGGQASLKTLIDESDYSQATLLLSVLGEGSFLSLLHFLQMFAPDALTRQICRLAAKDEARHVLFAMEHLQAAVKHEPGLLHRFAAAIERRHAELTSTAGLNEEVFNSLTILAAGAVSPTAIANGFKAVKRLENLMHIGRVRRLRQLGFSGNAADGLSQLHTRNFM